MRKSAGKNYGGIEYPGNLDLPAAAIMPGDRQHPE